MKNHFKLKSFGSIKYLECQKKEFAKLTLNAFSARYGGISHKPYDSLNLSFNVGDEEKRILENRVRFLRIFNISHKKIVSANQVHGENIVVIEKKDEGKGALDYKTAISKCDSLITNIPGIPLFMSYADCVPVLILDPVKKIIGLVHAGRTGTFLKIALKTLQKMKNVFGSISSDCQAVIFPSIGSCCYRFKDRKIIDNWITDNNLTNQVVYFGRDKHWRIDLKKANYIQLLLGGLHENNIFVSEECTVDNSDLYFSHHRDEGKTGRMAALFMIKKRQ